MKVRVEVQRFSTRGSFDLSVRTIGHPLLWLPKGDWGSSKCGTSLRISVCQPTVNEASISEHRVCCLADRVGLRSTKRTWLRRGNVPRRIAPADSSPQHSVHSTATCRVLPAGGRVITVSYRAFMAERQGFEPWIEFPLYTLSKRAPSTTRPSLRYGNARLLTE